MNSFATFVIVWILVSIGETMGSEFRALPEARQTTELAKSMFALRIGCWLGFLYLIFAIVDQVVSFVKSVFS